MFNTYIHAYFSQKLLNAMVIRLKLMLWTQKMDIYWMFTGYRMEKTLNNSETFQCYCNTGLLQVLPTGLLTVLQKLSVSR